jgi:xyloglucan-specific exo-beta-1,4-glucanase
VVRTGTCHSRPGSPARGAVSFDGGRTWKALASEPAGSRGAGAVTVSADGRTIVWTPQRSSPHQTVNQGTTWTMCAGLSAGLRVVADAVNPARFYAYDPRSGTLFASTNSAVSFSATGASFGPADGFDHGFGRPGGEVAMLYATPEREGDLWLAFRSGNLGHSTNGGALFVKVGAVQEARSLGFGKAAPGRNYPALYLAGRIDPFTALFRSDDAGQTWVRINDDQHQFGWINHVTGDPRIYGRVCFGTGGRGIMYGDPVSRGE